MTTLLEMVVTFFAPHDCLFCSKESNIVCAGCMYGLIDEAFCRCYVCGLPSSSYETCEGCRGKVSLDGLFAFGSHDDELKQIISVFKFGGARQVARDVTPELAGLLPYFEDAPIVAHIPTAYGRVRQRGFDHAHLLAKSLANYRQWPYEPLLRRHGKTRQLGAKRNVRVKQAAEMFSLRRPMSVKNKIIVLVDDVFTTGASMEAAAELLKAAGATRVYGVVIARAGK